jgi:hypothetical protein
VRAHVGRADLLDEPGANGAAARACVSFCIWGWSRETSDRMSDRADEELAIVSRSGGAGTHDPVLNDKRRREGATKVWAFAAPTSTHGA